MFEMFTETLEITTIVITLIFFYGFIESILIIFSRFKKKEG